MSAACNRAHSALLGKRSSRYPLRFVQAAADLHWVRTARRSVGWLEHQRKPALVSGTSILRCCLALVHVADFYDGQTVAGISTCRKTIREAGDALSRGTGPAAGQVMGGIGGHRPADGGAIVANRCNPSRGSMVAPGRRFLRALPTMPGENLPEMIERSESIRSGFVVTPGQTAMVAVMIDWLNLLTTGLPALSEGAGNCSASKGGDPACTSR